MTLARELAHVGNDRRRHAMVRADFHVQCGCDTTRGPRCRRASVEWCPGCGIARCFVHRLRKESR